MSTTPAPFTAALGPSSHQQLPCQAEARKHHPCPFHSSPGPLITPAAATAPQHPGIRRRSFHTQAPTNPNEFPTGISMHIYL
eukprot:1149730-Pelagomonas_calceolata.AAC.4